MIMPQAMRRSGYDEDPGWLRLAGRIAQETSPVVTYRLSPEEIEKRFPSAGTQPNGVGLFCCAKWSELSSACHRSQAEGHQAWLNRRAATKAKKA